MFGHHDVQFDFCCVSSSLHPMSPITHQIRPRPTQTSRCPRTAERRVMKRISCVLMVQRGWSSSSLSVERLWIQRSVFHFNTFIIFQWSDWGSLVLPPSGFNSPFCLHSSFPLTLCSFVFHHKLLQTHFHFLIYETTSCCPAVSCRLRVKSEVVWILSPGHNWESWVVSVCSQCVDLKLTLFVPVSILGKVNVHTWTADWVWTDFIQVTKSWI